MEEGLSAAQLGDPVNTGHGPQRTFRSHGMPRGAQMVRGALGSHPPPPMFVFHPQHRTARQGGSHTASPGPCQPSLQPPQGSGPPGFSARAWEGTRGAGTPLGGMFLSPSPSALGTFFLPPLPVDALYSPASASCRYQSRPLEGSKTPLF